jgi:hypothetical protein
MEPTATRPEAHVELGVTAYIPKTYIPGDRQRMDVYRRLTRCESLAMLAELEKDVRDAFGEPPRQATVFFALTEVRLLAQIFGIDSVIRQPPDVVLKVNDAARAQFALHGAPGTLRLIDEQTVYLRMPPTFVESEAALMVLRNLMRQALDREQQGEAKPEPGQAPEPKAAAVPTGSAAGAAPKTKPGSSAKPQAAAAGGLGNVQQKPAASPARGKVAPGAASKETVPAPLTPKQLADLEKLQSLREIGVLTDEEFEAARKRLLSK